MRAKGFSARRSGTGSGRSLRRACKLAATVVVVAHWSASITGTSDEEWPGDLPAGRLRWHDLLMSPSSDISGAREKP